MSRARDCTMWAIANGRMILCGTFITRQHAIADLVYRLDGYVKRRAMRPPTTWDGPLKPYQKAAWDRLRKGGYRVIKVRISSLEKESA